MKDIYRFSSATKQLESSDNKLLEFLVQCRKQGFHFRFPPTTDKHQLKALIHPLNLTHKQETTLLNTYFAPISTFTFSPYEFFTSMDHQGQQAFPCQMCDSCAPKLFEHYGYDVAAASWCSQCHENRKCIDVTLIEHYRKYNIYDETICHQLPRARWCLDDSLSTYQSIEDIETVYQPVFETARKNANTVK